MGIRIIGKAVRIHISSKTARELITTYPTVYHLWFLEYQRVLPLLRLHLPLHHLHHKIPYLMSTDTQKIQYKKSTSEELRWDPLHDSTETENQNKNEGSQKRKYTEIFRISCLIGYRNSGRIWSMTVLQKSVEETQNKEVKTLASHLMNFQWSREQKWDRVRVSTVCIRTFRRTQIVISA